MTKAELISYLSTFSNDIEINVIGSFNEIIPIKSIANLTLNVGEEDEKTIIGVIGENSSINQ